MKTLYLALFIFSSLTFGYSYPSLNFALNQAKKENKKVVLSLGFKECAPCIKYKKNFITGNDSSHQVKNKFVFVNVDYRELESLGFAPKKRATNCSLKHAFNNFKYDQATEADMNRCFTNSGEPSLMNYPLTLVIDPITNSIYKISDDITSKYPYTRLVQSLAIQAYSNEIGIKLNKVLKEIGSGKKYPSIPLETLTQEYKNTFKN